MKKVSFFFLVAFFAYAFVTQAKIRTVNNNQNLPGNPGQYTTISAAITASSAGDTILVAGSPNDYAAFTLNKKLVIIGAGYNPDKQNPLTSKINGTINISATNASGSKLLGLAINSRVTLNAVLNDIEIRRCFISDYISLGDSTSNMLITENILSSITMNNKEHKNLLITNNIISGNIYYSAGIKSTYTPVAITHNLFLAGSYGSPLVSSGWREPLQYVTNAIITNNIFYNTSPKIPTSGVFVGKNNTFNNNLSYAGASLPTMPGTNNTGSGNLDNTDPMFTAIFATSGTPIYDFTNADLRLQSGSPAIDAGTDKTDIGPTGGLYPIYRSTNKYLTGEPPLPEVKEMDFTGNSAVAPGGTLEIRVKAKKID